MGLAERWEAPLGERLSPSLGRRSTRPAVEGCVAIPGQQPQAAQEQATRAAKTAAFLSRAKLPEIRPLPGAGPIRR